jgi:hypothetical protein
MNSDEVLTPLDQIPDRLGIELLDNLGLLRRDGVVFVMFRAL